MEISTEKLKQHVGKLLKYMMEKLNIKSPPSKLKFVDNKDNADDMLGKTGYYNPDDKSITIYITNRHPKDILRSIAHEMIHYTQDVNGKLDISGYTGPGYAQKNESLRKMEKQAFLCGNMLFRDYCDSIKTDEEN